MNALLALLVFAANPYEHRATAAAYIALAAMSPQSVQVEAKPSPEPEPVPEEAKPKPPVVQCLVFTMESCRPCKLQHDAIERELVPAGWKVGKYGDVRYVDRDDDSELTREYKVKMWPQVVLVKDGAEKKRYKPGPIKPRVIAADMNELRTDVKSTLMESPELVEPEPTKAVEFDDTYFGGRRFRR